MDIDLKHDLMKNFLGDMRSGQKHLKTTISNAMITSPEQKKLGMDLQNENFEKKEKEKKNKSKLIEKKILNSNNDDHLKNKNVKIERNPLILLKLF